MGYDLAIIGSDTAAMVAAMLVRAAGCLGGKRTLAQQTGRHAMSQLGFILRASPSAPTVEGNPLQRSARLIALGLDGIKLLRGVRSAESATGILGAASYSRVSPCAARRNRPRATRA